jgi:tetratricopeptide (TPR) repeat protein
MTRLHLAVIALAASLATLGTGGRPAEACIWVTGTSVDGDRKRVEGWRDDPAAALSDHAEHQRRATLPLGPTPAEDAPWSQRSDHAALLLYRGKAQEAIAILDSIERQHPGEYVVAANLGTAHELAGDDGAALRWIREAVSRNPGAHEGTEWLHVRVLEAKRAIAADPAWLETHTVLGLDFGSAVGPVLPSRWPDGRDAEATMHALAYQLHERTGFVKPPDAVVGDLLATYADLVAIQRVIETALPLYDLALRYQPPRAAAIQQRRDGLADRASSRALRDTARVWGPIAGIAMLLTGAIGLIVRRRRRRAGRSTVPAG